MKRDPHNFVTIEMDFMVVKCTIYTILLYTIDTFFVRRQFVFVLSPHFLFILQNVLLSDRNKLYGRFGIRFFPGNFLFVFK